MRSTQSPLRAWCRSSRASGTPWPTALPADAIVIGPQTAAVTKLRAARPQAVGADRVANAVAAETFYGAPAIVVDFGTATNIDVIDEDGYYIGGAIAPGIRISMDALAARAAKLASVPLEASEHAIGRDTEECIKVGAVTAPPPWLRAWSRA